MYGWEGRAFDDIARLCARRDPRKYPLGCMTTGTVAGTPTVLQWFRHRAELSAFLWRMEPQRWGIRLAPLTVLKEKTEPVFIRLDVEGPNEALRQAHNELTRPAFEIGWWGDFETLCTAADGWPSEVRRGFRGATAEAPERAVSAEEQASFIDFLRSQYLPPEIGA